MAEELNAGEWRLRLLALLPVGPEGVELAQEAVHALREKDREIARLRYLWPKNGLDQDVDIRQLMANHRSWTQQAEARADAAELEVARLRREVEFEACGADNFSGADALAEAVPQCAVHERYMEGRSDA